MRTWVQKVRRHDGEPTTHSDDNDSRLWVDPTGLFHVHVGNYSGRLQVTLIMVGKPYTFASEEDEMGKRVATGTLEEMQEVYETYVRML